MSEVKVASCEADGVSDGASGVSDEVGADGTSEASDEVDVVSTGVGAVGCMMLLEISC